MEWGLLWGALGFLAGGVLKGAVGAGAPLLGVPILALIYDVPLAVAVFTLPNLISNVWQAWAFRRHDPAPRFSATFAGAGAMGALGGSLLLVSLPGEALMATVGALVLVYIGVRLARPSWGLARETAHRLAAPMGLVGGLLQGAGGLSAPVSLTFLSAMRLERLAFIATVSVFFTAVSAVQIPTLWVLGVLTPERLALSALAVLPLFAGIPVGQALARRISRAAFDRVILLILAAIALRLIWAAVA
ncbi:MAG: sulfite exporter TauE/SafE family protein [Paracoccaceae bacterium]|jgi:uncharacterized membrane protein YfcA|nr:sulfite exporter TauE/SafE family protein [Paracoccaceae bacterium]